MADFGNGTGPLGAQAVVPSADDGLSDVRELQDRFHYKQELRRGLTLWHLIGYGLNYMGPFGPCVIVGMMIVMSGGTAALPYALAGVAMLFTAAGYAIMVPNFPLAGSVYNYISRGWNPYLGFMVGWVMTLDYLLFPAVATISMTYYVMAIFPFISFWLVISAIAIFALVLNIIGVDIMAKTGLWLLLVSEIVLFTTFAIIGFAAQNGAGYGAAFTLEAFKFENGFGMLMGATTLAVFNYLGFDAVTTMAEESRNPKRDIPRAVYLSAIIGGTTMTGIGYFAALMIPEWASYVDNADFTNAPMYVVGLIAAGPWFGAFVTAGFALTCAVFNVVSTAAAARLVYGMGRDDLLPRPVFGAINKRFQTPHWNIVIIIALIFIIAAALDLTTIANMINFGALIGFIMLNVLVIMMYAVFKTGVEIKYKRGTTMYWISYVLVPLIGVLVIGYVFVNIGITTMLYGIAWSVLGLIVLGARTKFFRQLPPVLEL